MRKSSLIVLVLCISGALGFSYYGYHLYADQQIPKTIDLSKDDALQLLQAQYRLEQAYELREQMAVELYQKYGVSKSVYKLDVTTGKFILSEVKPK